MNALSCLGANGPHPEHAGQLMLYGQFVGSWSIVSTWFSASGGRSQATGEWHFDWILGGRGIQDVLFRSGAPADTFGTTLRCYDARQDVWHVSWMQPQGGEFVHLIGRKEGDRIVQEGVGSDPRRRERWSFSEITADSFVRHGEVSRDDGRTWTLEQEMRAIRRRNP